MAITNFSIAVLMTGPAGATFAGQATTFQLVTPWGSSDICYSWPEVLLQLQSTKGGSADSGKMGNYFNLGTTNGISGSGIAPPLTATLWTSTP